jgi:hypothetical protein
MEEMDDDDDDGDDCITETSHENFIISDRDAVL